MDEPTRDWYILISHLEVLEPLKIASGLSLCPLKSKLSVFDLAAAGSVGFRGWALLEPIASVCKCQIESTQDAVSSWGIDPRNRAWLACALLALRGHSDHVGVASSQYSWDMIAGHQERTSCIFHQEFEEQGPRAAVRKSEQCLPRFTGDILDFHVIYLANPTARHEPVTHDDAIWIGDHFTTFEELAATSPAFWLALETLIDWRYTRDYRSAVARLWTGIEAIFGISSELVYRISILSASLLAPRGPQRRKKFKEVKELYGLRSKAVHGSKITNEKLQEALAGSYQLLADLLILMVMKGRVFTEEDFEAALFEQ